MMQVLVILVISRLLRFFGGGIFGCSSQMDEALAVSVFFDKSWRTVECLRRWFCFVLLFSILLSDEFCPCSVPRCLGFFRYNCALSRCHFHFRRCGVDLRLSFRRFGGLCDEECRRTFFGRFHLQRRAQS